MAVPASLVLDEACRASIVAGYDHIAAAAQGAAPVYGLNTGLGANLGYRIPAADIAGFQHQIMAGRAVACGDPLPEDIGRGIALYRIISAAKGVSGLSLEATSHLCAVYEAGISPVIPEYGSIGAADLVQNAYFGLGCFGFAPCWLAGEIMPGDVALARCGLSPPTLKAKEGLALISHSGLTVALGASALQMAQRSLRMAKLAVVLSYEGYGANRQILETGLTSLRSAPGLEAAASWYRAALEGADATPRHIQEALSFRLVASLTGAADVALQTAIAIWEDEANGVSDSPVVTADGDLMSAANFDTTAFALAVEQLAQAIAVLANASTQRMKRMMDPVLSGLPRYLSPVGGGSAGFVPSQKTAAALLAEIQQAALPLPPSAAEVSDGVEDVAALTPARLQKLSRQLVPFEQLIGLEAIVALQALDLRAPQSVSAVTRSLRECIRADVAFLDADRPLGDDITAARQILAENADRLAG